MFVECRDYLIAQLKAAGIKTPIITSFKQLKASGESHIGAVLPEDEVLSRSGSKTIYEDADGKHRRTKVFDRDIIFVVMIGDYDEIKCEKIYENFVTGLDRGIAVDGNYIPIELEKAEWVVKSDSLLQSKLAVQFPVKFMGGLYHDTDFAKVGSVQVTAEKEQ